MFRFDLGPLLQGQTRIAKVKSAYNSLKLLLVLEFYSVKPTYRKSWTSILPMCSDLAFGPSFKVKHGYPNLKVLITRLLLVLEVWHVKVTYTFPNFSCHLEFWHQWKMSFIWKTIRDGAIWGNFWTHCVLRTTHPGLLKN